MSEEKYKSWLSQYERYRQAGTQLNQLLIKALPKGTLEESAKKLGLYKKNKFVFHNDQEMAILADYTLYYFSFDGQSFITTYLTNHRSQISEENLQILTTMQQAKYCVLEIKEKLPHSSLRVFDVLREKELILIDKGLSISAEPGHWLASEILFFSEFGMTTGAALPLLSKNTQNLVFKAIKGVKFKAKNFDDLTFEEQSKFVLHTIRICLNTKEVEQIFYK